MSSQWALNYEGMDTSLYELGVIPPGKRVRPAFGTGFGLWYNAKPAVEFQGTQKADYIKALSKLAHGIAIGKHMAKLEGGGDICYRGAGANAAGYLFVNPPLGRTWEVPTDAYLQSLHKRMQPVITHYSDASNSDDLSRITRIAAVLEAEGIIKGQPLFEGVVGTNGFVGTGFISGANAVSDAYLCHHRGLVMVQSRGGASEDAFGTGSIFRVYARGSSSKLLMRVCGSPITLANATGPVMRHQMRFTTWVDSLPVTTTFPNTRTVQTGCEVGTPLITITGALAQQYYEANESYDTGRPNGFIMPIVATTTTGSAIGANSWTTAMAALFGSLTSWTAPTGMTETALVTRVANESLNHREPLISFGYLLGLSPLDGMVCRLKVDDYTAREWRVSEYATRVSSSALADVIEVAALDMGKAVPGNVAQMRAQPRDFLGFVSTQTFALMYNPLFSTEAFKAAQDDDKSLIPEIFVEKDPDDNNSKAVTFGEANTAANAYKLKFGQRLEIVIPGESTNSPYVVTPVHITRDEVTGKLVCKVSAAVDAQVLTPEEVYYSFAAGIKPTLDANLTFPTLRKSEGPYSQQIETVSYELFGQSYGSITQKQQSGGAGDKRWTVRGNCDGYGLLLHPSKWTPELHLLVGSQKLADATKTFGGLLNNPFAAGLVSKEPT